MFIKSLKNSTSPEIRKFSLAQEGVQKDVERAFGVLIARFHLLKRPCLLRDRETMTTIMRASIIMHNMIVESRRNQYASGLYGEAAVHRAVSSSQAPMSAARPRDHDNNHAC
jgi:hypothetical protein